MPKKRDDIATDSEAATPKTATFQKQAVDEKKRKGPQKPSLTSDAAVQPPPPPRSLSAMFQKQAVLQHELLAEPAGRAHEKKLDDEAAAQEKELDDEMLLASIIKPVVAKKRVRASASAAESAACKTEAEPIVKIESGLKPKRKK